MKIMTFNIQHALDYQKQIIDLDLFAKSIQEFNPDVCGLNEVRGAGPLEGYTDQTSSIGNALGYHHYFGEAIKVLGHSPYGNAIVSRFPFASIETIAIPDPEEKNEGDYYESRCVIRAEVELEGVRVCILVCHMGLNLGERKNAVSTICRLIDSTDLPIILMGDFNTLPGSPELQPICERLHDAACMDKSPVVCTYPSDAPNIKIDYIFYRGLVCKSVTTIERVISDHLPIIAEFSALSDR